MSTPLLAHRVLKDLFKSTGESESTANRDGLSSVLYKCALFNEDMICSSALLIQNIPEGSSAWSGEVDYLQVINELNHTKALGFHILIYSVLF